MVPHKKLRKLIALIPPMKSAVVAYSGGVDSSFLLSVVAECLPGKILAVTALSPTYTEAECLFAQRFCESRSIPHLLIRTDEFSDQHFINNPPNRCYYCKRELFASLQNIARDFGCSHILDASNKDDAYDYRPGTKAKEELGVRSPLAEVGLSKQDIRTLSKERGLASWNRPQMACLASRISYGERITKKKLQMVERAESYLRAGLSIGGNIRVRVHKNRARIEVDKKYIPRLLRSRSVKKQLHEMGFSDVTIDQDGYRSGSMNEQLV